MNRNSSKEEFLQFAIFLARTAGKKTLDHFQKGVVVDRKEDDSPVTIADRQAEAWIRDRISEKYPDHGIIGEEHGVTGENSSVQWILDPIDGTQSFIHGIPMYTTLIGITLDGEPEIGVIYSPATDELCEAAVGLGARYNGRDCKTGDTRSFQKSTLLSTDVSTFHEVGFEQPFYDIMKQCRLHRTWGDAYGHMMVATGRADIMLDPVLNIWDAAPLLPIIQEAGGVFLDFTGHARIDGGNGFSSNEVLAGEILSILDSRFKRKS